MLVTSSHDQQRPLLSKGSISQRLVLPIVLQDLFNLPGQVVQAIDDGVPPRGEGDPVFRELNRHHDQSDVLRSVGFSRSDTDLRSGVDVDTAVRFTRDSRSDNVDDSDVESSAFEAVAHREDRVGSFSRLGNENAHVVSEDGSSSIEEVGGELDRDGNLGKFFKD